MEIYETEEQQVDAIKSYWNKNGNMIIAGIVLGLSGFVGFNYYKDAQLEKELATSDAYQALVESIETKPEGFIAAGEKFIADNKDSTYSGLTALSLAKKAASHQDWSQVEKYLITAIESSKDEGIKAIATLRLARVQIQLDKVDAALTTLSAPLPSSFKSAIEEIKGDAYLLQDKKDLARTSYQDAIAATAGAASQSLQMKLDDLAENIILN
ncbi:tetratricopeptide repeat protein [Pseudocolwellia sp. AS88]|uniref:YfgM family protein n=1 Tax=Pseudocolwellia sp. AS88 TaxID=3063958 RepID=UPI0026F305CF|nr:tetratricopeptide repeat protein [Pseudocolwellia sp. AS88]MDO7083751.1 tetratricopeptide repeat protein [Pseudocolwellia sp. AS88]